jgi:hypothetical protein
MCPFVSTTRTFTVSSNRASAVKNLLERHIVIFMWRFTSTYNYDVFYLVFKNFVVNGLAVTFISVTLWSSIINYQIFRDTYFTNRRKAWKV